MRIGWRFPVRIAVVTLYVAFGWIAGLAVLFVALGRGARRFVRMRRALAPTIPCPWCGTEVPQYGPYGCGACRFRGLGWAWRCRCGAWAGHVDCVNPDCGLSVPNPLLPSP